MEYVVALLQHIDDTKGRFYKTISCVFAILGKLVSSLGKKSMKCLQNCFENSFVDAQ
jgi:hypothetical protein